MTADGAATVEALRAELARAKEQARLGNAAAMKATEELQAEKAAHGETRDKLAKMAMELKMPPTGTHSLIRRIRLVRSSWTRH